MDALGLAYLALTGLLAAYAFRDAPQRLIRAYREHRVIDRATYHAVNAASVLVLSAWLVAVVLGVDARLLGAPLGLPARLTGLALAVLGVALAAWARHALGQAFAPTAAVPPDARIVDQGPYAHVRHPFYAGLLVALLGGVLALDSRVTLLALAATAPLVEAIAILEEAHLVDELGEAYRAYRERVPRWVPGT